MKNGPVTIRRAIAAQLPHALLLGLALMHAGARAEPPWRAPPSFSVVFENCTEFAGLGPIASTQTQGLVPAGYSAAAFGPGVSGIVSRTASCERVSVDGGPAERAIVSQTGVNLVSPDGTGDISNYTLFYVTDSRRLAERLIRFGLPVRFDPTVAYEVNPTGAALELFIQAHTRIGSVYFLHGSVADPVPGGEFPFLANWYHTSRLGRLRMSTQIPVFGAGQADVSLYTARGSELGEILAGNRTTFPLLSLRGKFAHAVMTVTLAR